MPLSPPGQSHRKRCLRPITVMVALVMVYGGGASRVVSEVPVDTVIEIRGVQVRASRLFEMETAGMKETRVDSMAIGQKLNLSLSELLSENTPVYIKNHGRGALATASFRGTAPSHTQVNWNGININSPMLGMVDFSLIPVYIIDDITLKHGGASVSDQSGGLGGSINIGNRADWTASRQISYLQGVGSYATRDQFLLLRLGNANMQWRSRMYYNHSDNDYTFVNRTIVDVQDGQMMHPTDTNRHAAYNRYGSLQELYWQPSGRHMVSVQWWGQWAGRAIPRVISFEGAENSNISQQHDHDHKAVATWQWYGEHESLTWRTGYAFQQLDYVLANQVSGIGPVPAIYSESTFHSVLQHLAYQRKLSPKWSLEGTLNADHHRINTRDSVSRTGYDARRNDLSLFVALRHQLHHRVNLNLMIRQEITAGMLSPLIPFIGMDYLLAENNPLLLKASIARNYRHPSLNDLYWVPGGNPGLKPEKGYSAEAGMQHERTLLETNLQTEMTLFRSDIQEWIIWVPGFKGYWEPQNIQRVLSRGLETNMNVSGTIGSIQYRVMATYAYTRALNYGDRMVWGDASHGKQLVFIPVHSGNAMVNLRYNTFSITWQYNAYSERFTTSSNDLGRRNRLYPYFMNDLGFEKQWQFNGWGLQTGLKIYNLFDETYHTILYRPMPGRNFKVTVRVDVAR